MKVVENRGFEKKIGTERVGFDTEKYEVCVIYDTIAMVKVKASQKWGVVDNKGFYIVEPIWNNIELFYGKYIKAIGEFGNVSIFDFTGKPIMQASEYADISIVDGEIVATLRFAAKKVG